MVNKTTIFAKKERRNFSPCQLRIRDFVPTRARTHFSNRLKLWILNSLMPEPELSFLAHSPRSVFEVVQAGNHFVQNGINIVEMNFFGSIVLTRSTRLSASRYLHSAAQPVLPCSTRGFVKNNSSHNNKNNKKSKINKSEAGFQPCN